MKQPFFILFLLVGCATTHRYESFLNGWIGHNTSELYEKWGKPRRTFSIGDGNTVHEYHFKNRFELKNAEGRFVATDNDNTPVGCVTQWIADSKGTLLIWKWRGPDCTH